MANSKTKKRLKKKPEYKSFRITKKIKPPIDKKLSSVFKLFSDTTKHIWHYKKLFLGILLVFVALNILFVKGFSNSLDVNDLRSELSDSLGFQGFELNSAILGAAATAGISADNPDVSVYQSVIGILVALALIWAFRQTGTHPKQAPKTKEAFYQSTSSLVPFILVIFVIALQLLPMLAGLSMYSVVQSNGLAVTGLEQILWLILTGLLSLLSIYMISSSLFALFIVTLPNSTPRQALRSAKKVVAFRRWEIVRKIIAVFILASLIFVVVLYAVVAVIPWFAEWFVLLLSGVGYLLIIGSGYKLYRELL